MSISNIMDLADKVGFDVIDDEVEVWIESGAYDLAVEERAAWLSVRKEYPDCSTNQQLHRLLHPNGPYGWEFCARCGIDKPIASLYTECR